MSVGIPKLEGDALRSWAIAVLGLNSIPGESDEDLRKRMQVAIDLYKYGPTAQFNLKGSTTGRMSSSQPNMAQIPKSEEEAKRIILEAVYGKEAAKSILRRDIANFDTLREWEEAQKDPWEERIRHLFDE